MLYYIQVIDLYFNQGKNTREIAKELRMSLSSIGPIIKKERHRRSAFYNVDNANDGNNDKLGQQQYQKHQQHQQQHQIILSSQAKVEVLPDKQKTAMAYKLYDQGKTPVPVATMLCLFAKEATTYYLMAPIIPDLPINRMFPSQLLKTV